MSKNSKPELRVFCTNKQTICVECGCIINQGDFLFINTSSRHYCLSCADLDHLIYLPSGNTALTRRASKHSTLVAIVYRFSSARKRNERQGTLVESNALQKAEKECLSDDDARKIQRERSAEKRIVQDEQYHQAFAQKIRQFYPNCPQGRESEISDYACLKYSGRVGRSASAKQLDDNAVNLAVIAHVRHCETDYDSLLMLGYDRYDARETIKDRIDTILSYWRNVQEE